MYDSREKAVLDYESNLLDARQEGETIGLEKGLEKGKLAGSVQAYQGLLGESVALDAELVGKSVSELTALIASLQNRLRERLL